MENTGFLLAALIVIWAITFAYIILLFNRQKRVRREIESVEGMFRETNK